MLKRIIYTLIVLQILLLPSPVKAHEAPCETIGILGEYAQPTTGYTRFFGNEVMQGASLAIAQDNHQKNSSCIQLVPIETHNSLANIPGLIQQAATKNIHFFVGLGTSDQAFVAIESLKKTGSLLITPTASADALSKSGRIITFFPTNKDIAHAIAKYLIKNNVRKIAIIYTINRYYSKQMMQDFSHQYTALGGEITSIIPLRAGEISLESHIKELTSSNFHHVFLPLFDLDAAKVILELQKFHIQATLIGSDSWGTYSKTIKNYLQLYENKNQISIIAPFIYDVDFAGKENKTFTNLFLNKFHHKPTDTSAFSYDSILLVKNMLKQCKRQTALANTSVCLSKTLPLESTMGLISQHENLSLNKKIIITAVKIGGRNGYVDNKKY